MTINEKIDEIILARKSKIKNIQKTIENLSSVKNSIERFEDFRDDLEDDNFFANIKNIDVQKLKDDCEKINSELERLEKRFSRDRVHLTFVGKAGQGKSLVMQNISGLGKNIIPSADGTDCTGAKSIITNTNSEDVKAEITFFTEEELVGIVNNYLETIFGKGKISKVNSIKSIKKLVNYEFPKLDNKESEVNSKFKHLKKYIEHIKDFEEFLGEKKIVDSEDIEKYVAQYKSDDIEEKYYNFLGVKKADIQCHFPYEDCGKIVLVDTIGLGATSLGVEDEMLNAVKNDSDSILYMFRPDSLRPKLSTDDYSIIEKITKYVSPEYTQEMLFWIFNKVKTGKGENTKVIPELMADVENLKKENGLAICQALEVDCNDKDDVEEHLLKPILKQMSERLKEIDDILLSNAQNMLDNLFKDYTSFVEKVEKFKITNRKSDLYFKRIIKETFGFWTNELKKLVKEYDKKRNSSDEHILKSEINKKKEELLRFASINIEDMVNVSGYKRGIEVYDKISNYVRISIINTYRELDGFFDDLVNKFKFEVIDILANEGKFSYVLPVDKEKKADEWLDKFLDILPNYYEYEPIHLAISALRDFRFSTQNDLIYEIRNSLDPIDSDISGPPDNYDIQADNDEEVAKNIETLIKRSIADVKRNIDDNCERCLKSPNKALFSTIKDFYDRVTFSVLNKEGNIDIIDMTDIWIDIYNEYIPIIWSDEWKKYDRLSKQSEMLKQIIDETHSLKNKNIFMI